MRERWRRLALCASLMGLVLSSVAACGTTLPSAVPTHTPTLVGCAPISTATQSQHAGPSQPIVTGVSFGGPLCAFAKKYGDTYATDYHWQGLELATHFEEAVDGELHASELLIYPLDRSVTWTMPQAEQTCLPFLPPDALHQHDGQDTSGDLSPLVLSLRSDGGGGPHLCPGRWEDLRVRFHDASVREYCSVGGLLIGVNVGGTISYLASDGLGSVSEALSTSGTVTAAQLYGPYGTVRYSSGTMPTVKGFTGQRSEATSGLDYYGARYYDPLLGQFTTADTKQGPNRFAYVALTAGARC